MTVDVNEREKKIVKSMSMWDELVFVLNAELTAGKTIQIHLFVFVSSQQFFRC